MMRNQEEHIKSVTFNEGVTIIRLAGSINYDNLKTIQDEFAAKTNGKKVENILFDVGEVADVRIPAYLDHLFRSSVTTYSGQP